MTFHTADMLLDDTRAMLGQPVYLLVALIITVAILTLFAVSLQGIIREVQIRQVDHELESILTHATSMFEYADEGTTVTVHVAFPTSLRFVAFGCLPTNSTQEPTGLSLDENTSNNYYYVMDDGTLRLFHSNARFSSHNCTQIAVFHSGAYVLTLELCHHKGKTYVTMY